MAQTLDKRLIIVNPNGTFLTTTFFKAGIRKDETEDDFISRQTNSLLSEKIHLKSLPRFIKTKDEINKAILSHPDNEKPPSGRELKDVCCSKARRHCADIQKIRVQQKG